MTNAGPKPPRAERHLGTFVCDITLDEFECWEGPDFVAASWWLDGKQRYCFTTALPLPYERELSARWKRVIGTTEIPVTILDKPESENDE